MATKSIRTRVWLASAAWIGLCAVGASQAQPGAASAPAPASAPVARRAPAAPDLLQGAVDPYDPSAERGRFFQAAGVDNELDAKEFAAARGKEGSFARSFDRWEELLAFDRNGNRTLDWFEADAYRQDARKRILEAFDTDKDGRLTGKERDEANAALAAGRMPRLPAPATRPHVASRPAPGTGNGPEGPDMAWMRDRVARQREMLHGLYDLNRDGRVDEAERAAMLEAVRRETEDQMAEHRLRRWDLDGDGRLSEEEGSAMEAAIAAGRARAEQWRRQRELARWDADGDGRLDERELAAQRAAEEEARREGLRWRDEWEMRQYDLNRNGELDEDERLLVEAARTRADVYAREEAGGDPRGRQRWQQVLGEWRMRHFDADGDGEIGQAEQADVRRFQERMRDLGRDMRNRFADLDGDGRVTPEEEAASREEWRRASWTMFAKAYRYMDADGDGQIAPREREEFGLRVQAGAIRWAEQFGERFDRNRDGRLDERERDDLLEGIQRDFGDRIRRFDADGDGRLSPPEAIRMMEDFVQRELGIEPRPEADEPPPPRR